MQIFTSSAKVILACSLSISIHPSSPGVLFIEPTLSPKNRPSSLQLLIRFRRILDRHSIIAVCSSSKSLFSNSVYLDPLHHMWLLCSRRHVVGGPFYLSCSGITLPAALYPNPSLFLVALRHARCPRIQLDLVSILALRFSILVLSRFIPVLHPWPSYPRVLDIVSSSTTHSCIRILPWSSTLSIPGSSSPHSRRCVLHPWPSIPGIPGSSSPHSRMRSPSLIVSTLHCPGTSSIVLRLCTLV